MKKKMSPLTITLIVLLTIIVIAVVGGGIYLNNLSNKVEKVETTEEDLGITEEAKDDLSKYETYNDIINIALFGIDAGDQKSGRSDSIMILTIDPINNKMKVSSIMRDSYVNIPGRGDDKINHAFRFGNSVLALKTINQNFKLNIDKFVATNFNSLPKIVNKLGGVELNVKDYEIDELNKYIGYVNRYNNVESPEITKPGVQLLDGYQTLAYSRIRKIGNGDYERTSRHRTVLNALFKKITAMPPTQLPGLLNELLPLVQTNMDTNELLKLGSTVLKINSDSIIEERFPKDEYSKGEIINGIWYLVYDREETAKQMHEFIYGK